MHALFKRQVERKMAPVTGLFSWRIPELESDQPSILFHYTTAYDISRHCGVEVGKRDFMGTPVTL